MNKAKKKEYTIEKLSAKTPFDTLDSVKTALKQVYERVGDSIGYIEPGHGLKGKQKWLLDDDDVSEMYAVHKNKREVMLYAFVDSPDQGDSDGTEGPSQKRPKQSEVATTSRKDVYTKTITQVETIMAKLKEKHGSQYDAERYACWAHTIQSGKHA